MKNKKITPVIIKPKNVWFQATLTSSPKIYSLFTNSKHNPDTPAYVLLAPR